MWRDLSNTTALNRLTLQRQSEATTYRAKHLTSISTIAYLPLLFPPVFTVNDECLGEELVYDRSRFLERHEAPSLAREAEGLQSAEDVIHVTHEPSEQKDELQPSKRTRRANKTKATPTTTHTTKKKTPAHSVTPRKGTPVPPATPATPAPPMTTLATPVSPASMLVTPAMSVNTSAGVKTRRETQGTHEEKVRE